MVSSVIVGASTPEQVSANVNASWRRLDQSELDAVDAALRDSPDRTSSR
jgi:aryl-alcohol dehydrogenase-like predicted oxidoreductase